MSLIINRYLSVPKALLYIIIARLSCAALANIPIFSMRFLFGYGVLFVLSFFIVYKGMTQQEFKGLLCLLAYIIYVLITTIGAGLFNTTAFNAYILCFLYFIFLYLRRADQKTGYTAGIVAIVGYVFTILYSIPLLLRDPDLARKMAASAVQAGSTGFLNFVGGFDTVYGSVLLIVMMLYLLGEDIPGKSQLLLRIGIVSGFIFLVLASYGTALVLMVLAITMILYKKNKIWALFVTVVLVFAIIFRESIGYFLYSVADHIQGFDTLRMKIDDIATMLVYGESAGTLAGDDGRISRMMWSLNTFFRNPIFGGYGQGRIGGHSELLDGLGQFGLVGMAPFLAFWVIFLKINYRNAITRNSRRCFMIVVILYLLIAILDPALFAQQILPFFVVFPMFSMVRDHSEKGG